MEESPIFSRTPRRKSRYSLYQSDYETAGEDSDSSLYYSVLEDLSEENDRNKENSIKQHNGQHSLLGKCLQKNMNLTPRYEFNKRVSFNLNPLIPPTTMHSSVTVDDKEMGSKDKAEKSKNEKFSNPLRIPTSSTINISTGMFDIEKSSTDEVDESLNSTIIGNQEDATTDATEGETSKATEDTRSESTEGATSETIKCVRKAAATANASTSILVSTSKTTDICRVAKQCGQASKTENMSTTFRLSNLPIPKKIFIAKLPNPPAVTLKSCVPSRLSLFRGHSTENNGSPRKLGKTGVPRMSTIGATNNTLLHTSVIPLSSLTCKYCDKSFAKPLILQIHLLEKCDKIPTARHRQLSRQQTYPTMFMK